VEEEREEHRIGGDRGQSDYDSQDPFDLGPDERETDEYNLRRF